MTLRVVQVASGREWRGGQRQVLYLAQALAAVGDIDQRIVTGRGSELARRLEEAGLAVDAASWQAALDPRVLCRLLALAKTGTILHAHDAHALVLAQLAVRARGGWVVATRRTNFSLRRSGPWARADRIITVSEAVRSTLVAGGVDPARISVVYSGIPLPPASLPPRAQLRAALGISAEALLVVAVGALTPEKDHVTLLEALAEVAPRLPTLQARIAGDGPLRSTLEHLIQTLGLEARVRLLGWLPDPAALIHAADLFVQSSREEGLGTTVLDAMAHAVPIVATGVGGVRELLAGGAGLLVPPATPRALADAIALVLSDAALRHQLAQSGRAAVAHFSNRRMAEAVRAVYRSLVQDH